MGTFEAYRNIIIIALELTSDINTCHTPHTNVYPTLQGFPRHQRDSCAYYDSGVRDRARGTAALKFVAHEESLSTMVIAHFLPMMT